MIAQAKHALEMGQVILYPTDTVWGLGCDALNTRALNKIFEIKQRPKNKSVILLVNGLDMLSHYVEFIPNNLTEIIEPFNDRPLTIIYPKAKNLPKEIIHENGSIAIRIPNHPFCLELINAFNKPIVSTSANISNAETPKHFNEISTVIKNQVDLIIEQTYNTSSQTKPSRIIRLLQKDYEIIRE